MGTELTTILRDFLVFFGAVSVFDLLVVLVLAHRRGILGSGDPGSAGGCEPRVLREAREILDYTRA